MKKQHLLVLCLIVIATSFTACKQSKTEKSSPEETTSKTAERIITLNGALSEIVYDLGHGKELVGRDVTSTYPAYVKDSVKDLGHVRSLTIEAIMQQHPTVLLAFEKDLSPKLKKAIEASGITVHLFQPEFSVKGTKTLVKKVAGILGETEGQKAIFSKIDQDLASVKTFKNTPKVLFIYARGAGTLMVAGTDTEIESMIDLAGGQNAITAFSDFKPLTEEAILSVNPDVLLLFTTGLESLGGKDGLLKAIPAVTQTNAGKNKAIIAMDGGLLFNFGPRVGEAAKKLNQRLAEYAK